jgi:hypothetical protein
MATSLGFPEPPEPPDHPELRACIDLTGNLGDPGGVDRIYLVVFSAWRVVLVRLAPERPEDMSLPGRRSDAVKRTFAS